MDGQGEAGTIALAQGYRLYRIQTDRPARVRLYATPAHRDSDAPRVVDTDPIGDHGLMLEYVTTPLVLSAVLAPFVDGANLEATPSPAIPYHITNTSGATGSVTATFTYIRTE